MNAKSEKDTLKNILRYFSSSLFSSLLSIINAFIKPRFLTPELYGLWSLLNIIPLYVEYSDLGTRTAMRYLIPLHRGKKEYQHIKDIKGNVIFGSLYISILIAIILVVLALIGNFNLEVKTGLICMAIVIILNCYHSNYVVVLKGYQQFKLLTHSFYLKASLNLVLGAVFLYFFNIYGLYVSIILSYILVNLYLKSKYPLKPYSNFNVRFFYQLVKKGFPMLVFGFGSILISTSDRIIIASLLGNEQLGFFSIAIMIMGFFLSIPGSVQEVMEPDLMVHMNSRSMQENVKHYFLSPLINLAYFLPLVMGPVIFIIPVLIPLILPGYSEGIVPTQIMIIGGYFFAMSYTARGIIIANHLQIKAIGVMSISIPVNVFLSVYFIDSGLGITGVAIASSFSYMLLLFSLLIFIKKNCKHFKDDWSETMKGIALPFPIIAIITVLLLYVSKMCFSNEYMAAIFGLSVYSISSYFLITIAAKKYTLLKKIKVNSFFNNYFK